MQVIMLSTKMFPMSVRSTFELPVWPYREGPGGEVPHEFRDYLRELNVFYYLDDYSDDKNNFTHAILVPNDEGQWPHEWKMPMDVYRQMVYIHDDTLEVGRWPNDQAEGRELYQKIVSATGDDFAWGEFNKPVTIAGVSSSIIRYIAGHNVPGNISKVRSIKLPNSK